MYGRRVFSFCLFDEPHAASYKERPLCDKGLHVYSSGIDSPLPLLMTYSFTLIQRKCVLMLSFVCFLEANLVSRLEILSSQKPFMATHCGIDSLRSRRLEVVGERENGRARARISCAHHFQAPATQAMVLIILSLSTKVQVVSAPTLGRFRITFQ